MKVHLSSQLEFIRVPYTDTPMHLTLTKEFSCLNIQNRKRCSKLPELNSMEKVGENILYYFTSWPVSIYQLHSALDYKNNLFILLKNRFQGLETKVWMKNRDRRLVKNHICISMFTHDHNNGIISFIVCYNLQQELRVLTFSFFSHFRSLDRESCRTFTILISIDFQITSYGESRCK